MCKGLFCLSVKVHAPDLGAMNAHALFTVSPLRCGRFRATSFGKMEKRFDIKSNVSTI
jgi:hypothetical protein